MRPAGTDARHHNEETATYLRTYMSEFRDHVERVLTVLPRTGDHEPLG